ncbi:MAG: nucleotide sugar dehydrogenase [Anaerolineaceae bacterium]|nr:nucleotide sugar dehydrogenase [Anaerolineaceae bacterium]
MRFRKLCIIGLGYIGLPTASTFATHGIQVTGVDVDPAVVESLQNGKMHIHEPGLQTIVQAAIKSGNLKIQPEPEEADAFIIAVQTPFFKDDKRADMRYVISATESIIPFLKSGDLVILESTSPPRTTVDLVVPILERSGLKAGVDFHLAYSPERVLPGQILRELIENARVIGGIDQASAEAGRQLYEIFVRAEIILTDATTAEMVKLMENTYRDINIAVANEFSRLTDRLGVDVWEAIEIANRHPRVNILKPGPGVGGHCVSVDPWFLVESAPDLASLIHAGRLVNDTQPKFVVELIRRAAGGDLKNKRIAALGLSYKANVDDFRESPALEVVRLLTNEGALLKCFDPNAARPVIQGFKVFPTLEDSIRDTDILLLLVDHSEFSALKPDEIRDHTTANIIIDTVNKWNDQSWLDAGFQVYRLGVGNHESSNER